MSWGGDRKAPLCAAWHCSVNSVFLCWSVNPFSLPDSQESIPAGRHLDRVGWHGRGSVRPCLEVGRAAPATERSSHPPVPVKFERVVWASSPSCLRARPVPTLLTPAGFSRPALAANLQLVVAPNHSLFLLRPIRANESHRIPPAPRIPSPGGGDRIKPTAQAVGCEITIPGAPERATEAVDSRTQFAPQAPGPRRLRQRITPGAIPECRYPCAPIPHNSPMRPTCAPAQPRSME